MKPGRLRKITQWGGGAAVLLVAGVYALAANEVRSFDPPALTTCVNQKAPFLSWTCKQFISHRSFTPEEVAQLNAEAGVIYPVLIDDKREAEALLRRFIEQGVQIDAIDTRVPTLPTALHTEVGLGRVDHVEILLRNGARTDVKDGRGQTQVELAAEMHAKYPHQPARAQIVALLEGARKH